MANPLCPTTGTPMVRGMKQLTLSYKSFGGAFCVFGPRFKGQALSGFRVESIEGFGPPVQLDYTPTPRQPTWGFCVRLDQEIEFLDIYQ